jgi:hypothetical protein
MADVASDVRQRFVWAMDVCFEAYEVLPDGKSFVRSDEDQNAIEVFEKLRETVGAVPPSLTIAADEFRAVEPGLFEKLLARGIRRIGLGFSPTSATDFVEALNRTMQRRMAGA